MDKEKFEDLRMEGIYLRHSFDDILTVEQANRLNRIIEIELLLERAQKREITIPLSENDIQELSCGEEYHWTFPTKQGEDINVYLRPEVEEDLEEVGDDVNL